MEPVSGTWLVLILSWIITQVLSTYCPILSWKIDLLCHQRKLLTQSIFLSNSIYNNWKEPLGTTLDCNKWLKVIKTFLISLTPDCFILERLDFLWNLRKFSFLNWNPVQVERMRCSHVHSLSEQIAEYMVFHIRWNLTWTDTGWPKKKGASLWTAISQTKIGENQKYWWVLILSAPELSKTVLGTSIWPKFVWVI